MAIQFRIIGSIDVYVLGGTTEDALSSHGQPRADMSVQLCEIVVDANIRCVADGSLGHGKDGSGSGDSDRGRKSDPSTTTHCSRQ